MEIDLKKFDSYTDEQAHRFIERAETAQTEAAKAFMILNSAAVAAILAFVQALAGKQDATLIHAFKPFAVVALILFLAGALASGLHFQLRVFSLFERLSIDNENRGGIASVVALFLAPLCFFFGGLIAVIGVAMTF